MATIPLPTFFAPAERADDQALRAQNEKVAGLELVRLLLDSFPEGAVILNSQRQIVHANDKVASFLGHPRESLVGLRLGEALECIHAHEAPAGCGTTTSCRYCGAAQAMEASRLNQTREVQECRILRSGAANCPALELRVWAVPLELMGERFTILALRDISDEKRRQLLERIFFHDLMNLAGGIRGILEVLPDLSGVKATEFEHLAATQAEQMVEEIECQRDLTAAEKGDLSVHLRPVDIRELLDRVCFLYRHHQVAEGKILDCDAGQNLGSLATDPTLLRRVIGNLIKNALEASHPGEKVTVRYALGPEGHEFAVNNPAVMPEAVRAQIFQRSFTSKPGKGRGLGSYSVKLLTERYLQGKVTFESLPGKGTTFRVTLPERPADATGSESGSTEGKGVVEPNATPSRTSGAEKRANGAPAPARLRILLAEDNPVNQKVALGMLKKWGKSAVVANNGHEVLTALEREHFDLIFMDVQMPELDGYETTTRIREKEKQVGGHISIVAMTAHSMKGDKEKCLEIGMDDYISKPVRAADMFAVIQREEAKAKEKEDTAPVLERPVLDPSAMARLRGLAEEGGSEFLAVVVEAFLQDSQRRLSDLREAAERADAEQLRKSAHALKGAAGEVGAARVAEICLRLETLGGSHTTDGAGPQVARLEQALIDVQSELTRQMASEVP